MIYVYVLNKIVNYKIFLKNLSLSLIKIPGIYEHARACFIILCYRRNYQVGRMELEWPAIPQMFVEMTE